MAASILALIDESGNVLGGYFFRWEDNLTYLLSQCSSKIC